MATYTPTNKQSNAVQQTVGGMSAACAVWEIGSATLGTADTLQGPTIPANSVIVSVALSATDIDTSTTVALHVGDSGDADRFISGATIGRTGGQSMTIASTGGGYKYTSATRVDVTAPTASAGGVAGGTLALEVRYITLEATS